MPASTATVSGPPLSKRKARALKYSTNRPAKSRRDRRKAELSAATGCSPSPRHRTTEPTPQLSELLSLFISMDAWTHLIVQAVCRAFVSFKSPTALCTWQRSSLPSRTGRDRVVPKSQRKVPRQGSGCCLGPLSKRKPICHDRRPRRLLRQCWPRTGRSRRPPIRPSRISAARQKSRGAGKLPAPSCR